MIDRIVKIDTGWCWERHVKGAWKWQVGSNSREFCEYAMQAQQQEEKEASKPPLWFWI